MIQTSHKKQAFQQIKGKAILPLVEFSSDQRDSSTPPLMV